MRAVADQSKLAVVGLAEVVTSLPRIWGEYRRLVEAAGRERPDVAILTDSSGFHLRVAKALKQLGIPVIYLVAPQAWAWRKGRVRQLRRNVAKLLCIFPFEEKFFRAHGVSAYYIGHPLSKLVRPSQSREAFFAEHQLDPARPLVALLPGSRRGEIARHLPIVGDTVKALSGQNPDLQFVLGTPAELDTSFLDAGLRDLPVKVAGGQSWNLMAYCDVAATASGTVTVEAALLGTPMVTFYRVSALTWLVGRQLVNVPHFSMVNLIAERRVVPELIQDDATGAKLAAEISKLLTDSRTRESMKKALGEVASALATEGDPLTRAAGHVVELIENRYAHR